MRVIRAGRKIEKAVDALIDLQQDYNDECEAAGILYEVQTILDKLNGLSVAMDAVDIQEYMARIRRSITV